MTKNTIPRPPRLTEKLLKHVFPDEGIFTTIGDLEEVYHNIAEENGIAKASRWYRVQAFRSILSYLKNQFIWSIVMFKNYLVFTSRLIKRDKFHYFLNFLGLSTGIACSIIIMMFLRNELTHDQHHEKADRIYRISKRVHWHKEVSYGKQYEDNYSCFFNNRLLPSQLQYAFFRHWP